MIFFICIYSKHIDLYHSPMKQRLLTPRQPSLLYLASQINEVIASELAGANKQCYARINHLKYCTAVRKYKLERQQESAFPLSFVK